MIAPDPKPILIKFLRTEGDRLARSSVDEAMHFIGHGECGLAYDGIVSHVQDGSSVPSELGTQLIKDLASVMGVKFPAWHH